MIGDNIRKLRKKKGLSQDNLARKADIPYTTLTKIESNVVKSPSVQNVAKIAKALGVSVDQLLEE
jgi:transcriptional regulator with XRE-family HTH domain